MLRHESMRGRGCLTDHVALDASATNDSVLHMSRAWNPRTHDEVMGKKELAPVFGIICCCDLQWANNDRGHSFESTPL